MATTMRFEVLGGKHTDRKGKDYKKGDVVEAVNDLTAAFPNKFKRLADVTKLGGGKIKVVKDDGTASRGADVTEKFADLVGDVGLQVFKRDDLFHIYESGSAKPLNAKGLPKDQVKKFITAFLEK